MARSLRRGLLTAAAVWAATAVAGNEWENKHEDDSRWLATTVTVTSTVHVDLKDYESKCQRGDWSCGPTPPPFPDEKPCLECQKWEKKPETWQKTDPPVDVFHGLWPGCKQDNHCPTDCNCSPNAICEKPEGPKCTCSTECPEGEMCNSHGACQPVPGPRCEKKACESKVGPQCSTNKDCGHGEICNHWGFCQKVTFPDCEKNSDCKWGQICTQWGICKTVDEPQCTCDTDCKDGQICNSQKICQELVCPKCKWDGECESGEVCKDGTCKPKEHDNKCKGDEDCDDGKICDWEGQCRRGEHFHCKVDSECKYGEVCDIHGKCQKKPTRGSGCGSDSDCKGDEFCNAYGSCEAKPFEKCKWDGDCLPGEFCSNHKCVARLGCEHSKDCRDGEVCEHNICVISDKKDHKGDDKKDDNKWKDHKGDDEKKDDDKEDDGKWKDHKKDDDKKKDDKKDECHNDFECRHGQKCDDGKCVKEEKDHSGKDHSEDECEVESDCTGDNQACREGVCVEKIWCHDQSGCGEDEECNNNVCEPKFKNHSSGFNSTSHSNHTSHSEHSNHSNHTNHHSNHTGHGDPSNQENREPCNEFGICNNGLVCKGGFCRTCTFNTDCGELGVCYNGGCRLAQTADICTPGFNWAFYKLNRAASNDLTLPGTIPEHPPASFNTWPVLQFRPDIAVLNQSPLLRGFTQTLGIPRNCPFEHARVYGIDTGVTGDFTIIQHLGYFVPRVPGPYTFTTDNLGALLDQSVYVWLGEEAVRGWNHANAFFVGDGSWTIGAPNLRIRTVLDSEVGHYIPIRILYVNPEGCSEFSLSISGPTGPIVSREQPATDLFFSNCHDLPFIPRISFESIVDPDLDRSLEGGPTIQNQGNNNWNGWNGTANGANNAGGNNWNGTNPNNLGNNVAGNPNNVGGNPNNGPGGRLIAANAGVGANGPFVDAEVGGNEGLLDVNLG